MGAWQSMRSAPTNGEYFLAVRYVQIADEEYVPEFHVICWEDWDEPGWFDQEGQEVSGPFVGWMTLPEPPALV